MMPQSDSSGHVVSNFNFEKSASEYGKVMQCVRLLQNVESKVNMEVMILVFMDAEDDKYSNAKTAIDTNLFMSTITPIDKEENFIEKVSNVKIVTRLKYVKDFERLKPDLMRLVVFAKAQENGVKVKLSIVKDLFVNDEAVKDDATHGKDHAKRIFHAIHCIKGDSIELKEAIIPAPQVPN